MNHRACTGMIVIMAGCSAGSQSAPGPEPPRRQPVAVDLSAQTAKPDNTYGLLQYEVEEGVVSSWVPASPDSVWRKLPEVYRDLGFEADALGLFDPERRQIGVVEHRTRRVLGERLAEYVRCGDSFGAPKANNGQVRLTVRTWLDPDEDGARISTTVSGWTRGAGASTGPIRCVSKGTLEREILNRATLAILRGGS